MSSPAEFRDDRTTVAELRTLLRQFVEEREWQRYHDAKNLAMSIAIEAGELMEHFQWLRSDELPELLASPQRRADIAAEVADVACYLLSLVNALELDLASTVAAKIARNREKYPVERFRGRYFRPAERHKPEASD